jgi:hypothetical protein
VTLVGSAGLPLANANIPRLDDRGATCPSLVRYQWPVEENYDEFSSAAAAAALLAAAETHIEGQHVVSQVVLKNFEGAVDGTKKIGVYSVRFGATRPIGRKKAGLVPNLLRVGSTSAEGLWAGTENRIDEAVEAVRQDGAGAPSLQLAVLRDAIALHFARSKVTVELLDGLWEDRGPHLVSAIVERNRPMLTAQFLARSGRQPTGNNLVDLVREYTSDGTQLNETGAWTRARVEEVFADLKSADRTRRHMVVVRPATGAEFLISDNPASTHLAATGEVRTPRRIGWDAADEIAMPFAPDLTICLLRDEVTHANSAVPVTSTIASHDRVAQLNDRQVRSARDYVFHQPGSDFAAQIAAGLKV